MKPIVACIFSMCLSVPAFADPCGLSGTIDERIQNCSAQPDSVKAGFVLVTRTNTAKEVRKEVSTGLLWSDRLPSVGDSYEAAKACRVDLSEFTGITGRAWRLPSIYDYAVAEKSGIRKALPNMRFWFWSTTKRSNSEVYVFSGDFGYTDGYFLDYDRASTRCIAN